MSKVVVLLWPPGSSGPLSPVAGVPLLERVIRDRAGAGCRRVLVSGAPGGIDLDRLAAVTGITVARLEPGAQPPEGADWLPADEIAGIRVTDERSRRRAEWKVLQGCRRAYDGLADRLLWRAVSLRVTRLLAPMPVTPNQVTATALALGLVGAALAAGGDRIGFALAGLLLIASLVLDSVDGELARVKFLGSELGMWLDNASDDILDNAFLLGLGAGLGGGWFALGAAAACARGFVAVATYVCLARAGRPGDVMAFRWWFEAGSDTDDVYRPSPLTLVRSIGRRDLYVTLYAVLCIVGRPAAALALGATISAVYAVMMALHLRAGGSAPDRDD